MDLIGSSINFILKGAFIIALIGLIVGGTLRNPVLDVTVAEKNRPPVDVSEIQRHVTYLTSIYPSRNYEHQIGLNQAASYISRYWQGLDLRVSEQDFQIEGQEFKNLIVSFGPEDAPDRIVLGAHYDVAGDQPGADDNASGVAALLEISHMLTKFTNFKRRIDLVAYTLEEPPNFATPRMGSAVHAASLKKNGVKVALMMSLEMLGYYSEAPKSQSYPVPLLKLFYPSVGNFIALVGDMQTYRAMREIKELMFNYSTVPAYSINAPRKFPDLDLSDHASFWAEDYPAIMVTDTAFLRNPNYHQNSDRPETLDFKKIGEVVSGVYGVVTEY